MNSSEQKDFDHQTPTLDEIEETIAIIDRKLSLPQINVTKNDAVREGYLEAFEILTNRKNSYDQISRELKTIQGKAIAVLAVDYLNGKCERKVLVGVPVEHA